MAGGAPLSVAELAAKLVRKSEGAATWRTPSGGSGRDTSPAHTGAAAGAPAPPAPALAPVGPPAPDSAPGRSILKLRPRVRDASVSPTMDESESGGVAAKKGAARVRFEVSVPQ
jgi:hypothetical protein